MKRWWKAAGIRTGKTVVETQKREEGESLWISVTSGLPEKDGRVLIYRNTGYIEIEKWEARYGFSGDGRLGTAITHWMPLPEPPGVEGPPAALPRSNEKMD